MPLPLDPGDVEVTVLMPCLNEAKTVGICVQKARRALDDLRVTGEVVVADNGSVDGIWSAASFGELDPSNTLRLVVVSATTLALGAEVILASFFFSILGLRRR